MTDVTTQIRKPRVLVVEDNEAYRNLVKSTMELAGFEVYDAENGLRGLEIARAQDPDLVLLDVYMPVMDGMSMLVELKKDEVLQKIPVIMLTNVQEELDRAVKTGAEEAILKSSVTPHQIIEACRKHLSSQADSPTTFTST